MEMYYRANTYTPATSRCTNYLLVPAHCDLQFPFARICSCLDFLLPLLAPKEPDKPAPPWRGPDSRRRTTSVPPSPSLMVMDPALFTGGCPSMRWLSSSTLPIPSPILIQGDAGQYFQLSSDQYPVKAPWPPGAGRGFDSGGGWWG